MNPVLFTVKFYITSPYGSYWFIKKKKKERKMSGLSWCILMGESYKSF